MSDLMSLNMADDGGAIELAVTDRGVRADIWNMQTDEHAAFYMTESQVRRLHDYLDAYLWEKEMLS